ncbi:phosphoenolpyruvate carboxylase [Artemisia annua]|uniref:Phosphoenolpyruvate carboxylase n=1 Tax=Artemisia annua TaxID=35608 RepID=A0A2U1KJM7_ARTAN|nr:phosphoenolpyruvate carboxylase [Artemisia annua]
MEWEASLKNFNNITIYILNGNEYDVTSCRGLLSVTPLLLLGSPLFFGLVPKIVAEILQITSYLGIYCKKPVSGYMLKDIGRGGIFVSGGENGVEEAAAATCTLSNPTGIWMYQLLTFLEWLNAKEFELKDQYNYVRGSDHYGKMTSITTAKIFKGCLAISVYNVKPLMKQIDENGYLCFEVHIFGIHFEEQKQPLKWIQPVKDLYCLSIIEAYDKVQANIAKARDNPPTQNTEYRQSQSNEQNLVEPLPKWPTHHRRPISPTQLFTDMNLVCHNNHWSSDGVTIFASIVSSCSSHHQGPKKIQDCLAQLYAKDITLDDKQDEALHRENELRRTPPTPQDEMRAGMKQSGRVLLNSYDVGINERVPYNAPLIRFSSWIFVSIVTHFNLPILKSLTGVLNVVMRDATGVFNSAYLPNEPGDDCISVVSNSSKVIGTRIACGSGYGIRLYKFMNSVSLYLVALEAWESQALQIKCMMIKTWQGGSGFDRNVKYENVSHPIIIDQYYCDSSKACPNDDTCRASITSYASYFKTLFYDNPPLYKHSDAPPGLKRYLTYNRSARYMTRSQMTHITTNHTCGWSISRDLPACSTQWDGVELLRLRCQPVKDGKGNLASLVRKIVGNLLLGGYGPMTLASHFLPRPFPSARKGGRDVSSSEVKTESSLECLWFDLLFAPSHKRGELGFKFLARISLRGSSWVRLPLNSADTFVPRLRGPDVAGGASVARWIHLRIVCPGVT